MEGAIFILKYQPGMADAIFRQGIATTSPRGCLIRHLIKTHYYYMAQQCAFLTAIRLRVRVRQHRDAVSAWSMYKDIPVYILISAFARHAIFRFCLEHFKHTVRR